MATAQGVFRPTVRLESGDALDILRREPSESVNCIVTSPPYWGLRDYGNPPTVWGGDPSCEHRFESETTVRAESSESVRGQHAAGGGGQNRHAKTGVHPDAQRTYNDVSQGFCSWCGAWRGCLGMEPTPDMYVAHLGEVFVEVRRVLRRDGTLWLNLGDSFAGGRSGSRDPEKWPTQSRNDHMPVMGKRAAGLKAKDLVGIPWRVAFALQAAGWYLRSDICWAKPNNMPESVKDRPTRAHEYIFLLTRAARYYYDSRAIAEAAVSVDSSRPRGSAASMRRRVVHPHAGRRDKQGQVGIRTYAGFNGRWDAATPVPTRNARDVWVIPPQPFHGAHFATMPEALVERCILAGCPEGGTVLDPFVGSGTVCAVAARLGRHSVGFDLNDAYVAIARQRAWPQAQPRMALTNA